MIQKAKRNEPVNRTERARKIRLIRDLLRANEERPFAKFKQSFPESVSN